MTVYLLFLFFQSINISFSIYEGERKSYLLKVNFPFPNNIKILFRLVWVFHFPAKSASKGIINTTVLMYLWWKQVHLHKVFWQARPSFPSIHLSSCIFICHADSCMASLSTIIINLYYENASLLPI